VDVRGQPLKAREVEIGPDRRTARTPFEAREPGLVCAQDMAELADRFGGNPGLIAEGGQQDCVRPLCVLEEAPDLGERTQGSSS
jgi:hypothetical protein